MKLFLAEHEMPDITQFSQIHLNESDTAQMTHLDVSSPRCVWGRSKFRSRQDEISYSRWRLGFLVFYGAAALLLGGLAMTADRPETFASTAAPAGSAIVNR
jgi:hypothetical protein